MIKKPCLWCFYALLAVKTSLVRSAKKASSWSEQVFFVWKRRFPLHYNPLFAVFPSLFRKFVVSKKITVKAVYLSDICNL